MNATDQDWLQMKRADLLRSYALFGDQVNNWELPHWLKIVNEQAREIRRMKTQMQIKEIQ